MPSGRIERRLIEALPAKAAGAAEEWPTVRQICRVTRWRQRKENGIWQETSLPAEDASPQALLKLNRGHWGAKSCIATRTSSCAAIVNHR